MLECISDAYIGAPWIFGVVLPVKLERYRPDDAVVGIHEAGTQHAIRVVLFKDTREILTVSRIVDHCCQIILLVEVVANVQAADIYILEV